MYPDDCIQSIIKPTNWWIQNNDRTLCRGALLFAFIPHVDQVPYTIKPVARKQADQHDTAILDIAPLRINQPKSKTELPVAAMGLNDGELWVAYRAKKRPCLVIGSEYDLVEKAHRRGMPNSHTAPTVIVAPYYGADRDGSRAGYSPEFLERVRHCEYPQFVWDKLPLRGPSESILRLDHLQPVGTHHLSYELSDHKLSDDAICIIDELLQCLIWGGVPENGYLTLYRQAIEDVFKTA